MADVLEIPDLPENGLQNEEFNSTILEPIRQSLANLEATNIALAADLAAVPTVYKDTTLPLTAKLRDLWIDPSSNYQARICVSAYASGEGEAADWEDLHDAEAYVKAENAELVAGTAAQTYLLNDPPTAAREGDLWVELDNNKQVWVCLETYTITELDPASKWEKTQDQTAVELAATVEGLVDGQVETFYDTDVPEAADARDIWVKEQEIDGEAVFTALMATSAYLATDGPGAYPSMAAFRESKWVLTTDPTALAAAEAAHGLADGKTYTHYLNAWPAAADARDIFHNMLTRKTYVCVDDYTSAYTGTMEGVKWERIQDPVAQARADEAWSLADGKVVTYIQATMPDAADLKDLWLDSDDNYKLYVCTTAYTSGAGTEAKWSAQTDNSKAVVYAQDEMPASAVERDLWVDTDSDRKQYVCIQTYTSGGQLGVNWLSTNDNKKVNYIQGNPPDEADIGDGWLDTVTPTGQFQFYICNTAYTGGQHGWTGPEIANSGKWTPAKDQATLSLAQSAHDVADGKTATYYRQTIPPTAGFGDTWVDTDDNKIYVCKLAYTSGGTVEANWDITADPVAQASAEAARSLADSKRRTFYSDEVPSSLALGYQIDIGDLWCDTNDDYRMYVCKQAYSGAGSISYWQETQDPVARAAAIAAQSAVDQKRTTFNTSGAGDSAWPGPGSTGQWPISFWADVGGAAIGDMWIHTNTSNGYRYSRVCKTAYTGYNTDLGSLAHWASLSVDATAQAALDLKTDLSTFNAFANQKGVANGLASLDSNGKLTSTQIPLELMSFKGNWDASTNSPTLSNVAPAAIVDMQGDTYRVNVGGTWDFGSYGGSLTFQAGDWVYCNGAVWLKGDNVDQVTSVNGATGAVVAQDGPTGAVTAFAGSSAPTGWLLCNGAAVSQTTYAALYAVIGVTYGNPGSGNFNLPDLKGKTVVMINNGVDAEFTALGQTGGTKQHTLSTAELASHTHSLSVSGTSAAEGAHTHGIVDNGHTHGVKALTATGGNSYSADAAGGQDRLIGGASKQLNPTDSATTGITISSDGSHTHTITSTGTSVSAGSGTAHNNLQPYIVLNYIIKT